MAKLAQKHAKAISDLILRLTTARYFIDKGDSSQFMLWAKEYNRASQVLNDNYGIVVTQYDLTQLEELNND